METMMQQPPAGEEADAPSHPLLDLIAQGPVHRGER
jgi:hypothetical protein